MGIAGGWRVDIPEKLHVGGKVVMFENVKDE